MDHGFNAECERAARDASGDECAQIGFIAGEFAPHGNFQIELFFVDGGKLHFESVLEFFAVFFGAAESRHASHSQYPLLAY